jgi:hypothetical protein
MPYKDPEAKRRYMARYYLEKIKTGQIPSTAYRNGSYGLRGSQPNKTLTGNTAKLTEKRPPEVPSKLHQRPKRSFSYPTGGAEYKERVPKGFTSLGNGVVMRFLK